MANQYCVLDDLMIHGDTGVGKSSIVARLIDTCDVRPEPVVREWVAKYHPLRTTIYYRLPGTGPAVEVMLWDFSSSVQHLDASVFAKSMESTRLFKYRKPSAVLLVYDVTKRETFQYVRDLAKRMRKNNAWRKTLPVLVVGNKSDCKPEGREVDSASGELFANCIGAIGFMETSCTTGDSVQQAMEQLLREAHKHIGDFEHTWQCRQTKRDVAGQAERDRHRQNRNKLIDSSRN